MLFLFLPEVEDAVACNDCSVLVDLDLYIRFFQHCLPAELIIHTLVFGLVIKVIVSALF